MKVEIKTTVKVSSHSDIENLMVIITEKDIVKLAKQKALINIGYPFDKAKCKKIEIINISYE